MLAPNRSPELHCFFGSLAHVQQYQIEEIGVAESGRMGAGGERAEREWGVRGVGGASAGVRGARKPSLVGVATGHLQSRLGF
jgi:hypothetical protein